MLARHLMNTFVLTKNYDFLFQNVSHFIKNTRVHKKRICSNLMTFVVSDGKKVKKMGGKNIFK